MYVKLLKIAIALNILLAIYSNMSIFVILGYALFVAFIMLYWYNSDWFRSKSEKKYPQNYGKHPDPAFYKKYK